MPYMAGGSGSPSIRKVGVGLVFEDGYAVSLGYFDHALSAVGAEGDAHGVLIDADGVDELGLYALGGEVLDGLFERVGIHAVFVGGQVDDVGAFAEQHTERAGVAELFDENGVAFVNEGVKHHADRASGAGGEEDVVHRDVHASVVAEGGGDVLAQSRMALGGRVLGEFDALAGHDVGQGVNEALNGHGVAVGVGYGEHVLGVLGLSGRAFDLSREVLGEQI